MSHAERAHALLGASGAHRWIQCTPSARLTEHMSESRSAYADEGTAAHELSEIKLRRSLYPCNSKTRAELQNKLDSFRAENTYYDADMEYYVSWYVDIVNERFMEAKSRSADTTVLLEERLDFSAWVPEGFGTGDVVLISDGVLEIIDLKYGKGIKVWAVGNPQFRLYALGAVDAYDWLYGIKEVRMTVVQPRLDHFDTEVLSVSELVEWGETVAKPAAQLAHAGEGEYQAGEHCQWCLAKGSCRARADMNMAALQHEFQNPALLTMDEIGAILPITEQLKSWAKDIEEFAYQQALKGNKIPQWKLVEGRSNRVISDKGEAMARLSASQLTMEDYLKPQELKGLGDLEKKLGKKGLTELLGDLIKKPQGKPVLVPEIDKRPELNSIESDFANENFE